MYRIAQFVRASAGAAGAAVRRAGASGAVRRRVAVGAGLAAAPLALAYATGRDEGAAGALDARQLAADVSDAFLGPLRAVAAATTTALVASSTDDPLSKAISDAFGGSGEGAGVRARSSEAPVVPQQRPRRQLSAAKKTVIGIIAANTLVFFGWHTQNAHVNLFMDRWFLTSAGSLRMGLKGLVTNITCAYSHMSLWHIAGNMVALWSFAPPQFDYQHTPQAPQMSALEFFTFYNVSGFLASLTSNALNFLLGLRIPSLGASGAIFSVATYTMLSYPQGGIQLFFVIPLSNTQGLLAGVVLNGYLVAKAISAARGFGKQPMLDGAAHLGGMAVGAAYHVYKRSTYDGKDPRV